jgi:hypothetical protein
VVAGTGTGTHTTLTAADRIGTATAASDLTNTVARASPGGYDQGSSIQLVRRGAPVRDARVIMSQGFHSIETSGSYGYDKCAHDTTVGAPPQTYP